MCLDLRKNNHGKEFIMMNRNVIPLKYVGKYSVIFDGFLLTIRMWIGIPLLNVEKVEYRRFSGY